MGPPLPQRGSSNFPQQSSGQYQRGSSNNPQQSSGQYQFNSHVPHAGQRFQSPSENAVNYPSENEERPITNEGRDVTDGTRLRVNVNTNITATEVDDHFSQQVHQRTPDIVTSFIATRMDYEGHTVPDELASRARNCRVEKQVADCLKKIGDEISNNAQLNDLIGRIDVTKDTAYSTFFRVAQQIFQDNTINWGRIVMLLYLAYKLALQVVDRFQLIDKIIVWATQFVAEKLLNWIVTKGGWAAIQEHFGSTTVQLVTVFFAGVFLSSLFWYYNNKS